VSGIFLPLRVKSLPLATIYEVKIPLRKWKKSLLQRNPAQMTSANVVLYVIEVMEHKSWGSRPILLPASCDAGKNIMTSRYTLPSNSKVSSVEIQKIKQQSNNYQSTPHNHAIIDLNF
jgi:hypothetical protein